MKYQITVVLECGEDPADKGSDRVTIAEIVAATASEGAKKAVSQRRNAKILEAYTEYSEKVSAI